jgi:5-methylcytosine-specific restriction endonuclease McrA
MFDYAINNETETSGNLPPFLIDNPIFRGDKAMTETTLTLSDRESQLQRRRDYYYKNKDRIAACQKKYYAKNKERIAKYKQKHQQEHKVEIAAYQLEYKKANKDKIAKLNQANYQNNKERRADWQREYDKKNKERVALRHKEYSQKHKKEIAAYKREHYQQNKEQIAVRSKAYRQTQNGRAADRRGKQKRRALKFNVRYEIFDSTEIFERDGYQCQQCGRRTRPDYKNPNHALYPNLDHIQPLSLGGAHTRQNTQCLCHACNMQKHNTGVGDQLRLF